MYVYDCSYDTGGDDEADSTDVDTTSMRQPAAVGDSTEHRLESRYTVMVFGILRHLAYSFCRVVRRNVYVMMLSYQGICIVRKCILLKFMLKLFF